MFPRRFLPAESRQFVRLLTFFVADVASLAGCALPAEDKTMNLRVKPAEVRGIGSVLPSNPASPRQGKREA